MLHSSRASGHKFFVVWWWWWLLLLLLLLFLWHGRQSAVVNAVPSLFAFVGPPTMMVPAPPRTMTPNDSVTKVWARTSQPSGAHRQSPPSPPQRGRSPSRRSPSSAQPLASPVPQKASSPSHSSSHSSSPPPSYDAAVAIVPPDDAWDRLQRARHEARDATFHQWPPAIRLLHPFASASSSSTTTTTTTSSSSSTTTSRTDFALVLADIVERYNLGAFTITLDTWSIIPHTEAIQAEWAQWGTAAAAAGTNSNKYNHHHEPEENEEAADIQALIAREEQLGLINKLKRQEKLVRQQQQQEEAARNIAPDSTSAATTTTTTPVSKSKQSAVINQMQQQSPDDKLPSQPLSSSSSSSRDVLLEQQKAQYTEFNGPCVIVLEPDEESIKRLRELRRLLLLDPRLQPYEQYSPTSSVSGATNNHHHVPTSSSMKRKKGKGVVSADYRPVLPIAAFSTVSRAIPMARQLRRSWKPLTFTVTDLHLVSRQPQTKPEQGNINHERMDAMDAMWGGGRQRSMDGTSTSQQQQQQFGCDALVMLMGHEIQMDDEWNQEMTNMLCEKGELGGFYYDTTRDVSLEEADDSLDDDLERWLNDDEDFDEGSVVVIGRTHFFTGEMRLYVGMPATSVRDGQDRLLGDTAISGAAKRRGAVHRSKRRRQDGEFGFVAEDHRPRPKRESRANPK